MKGRKPQPPELKVLSGTRPDRVNAEAPKAAGLPEPPAYLDDAALEEWHRLVPQLAAAGVLSRTDGAALALYCTTYSRYRAALRDVAAGGITASTGTGGEKTAPAVGVLERCEAMMAKLLAEFGATPSSRGRVKAADAEGPKDEFTAFLNKRKAR